MEITFFGVRALVPVPGVATVRYGGNTACTLVRLSDGSVLVLDCGTGARALGLHLVKQGFVRGQNHATFLLSHPRWDRVQGFPFFRPFYAPDNRFTIYGGLANTQALEAVLEGQMAAHYFPLHTFRNMGAALDLRALAPPASSDATVMVADAGTITAHDFSVGPARVHALVRADAGGAWAAYRIEDAGRVLVYAAAPVTTANAAHALCANADLLIHHAGVTDPHGSQDVIEPIVDLATAAQVRSLALFDYGPEATDADIDHLLARAHRQNETTAAPSPPQLKAAAEGLTVTL